MAGTNGRCDPYLPSKDALWSMRALRPLCSARTDHPRRGHHAIADGPRPAPALTRTSTTKRGASPQNDAACPQVNTPGVPGRTQEETRASQSGTNPVKKGKTVKKVKKKIKIKMVTKVQKSRKSAKPAAAKKPAKPSEAVFFFAKPWEAVSKDGRMFWWNTVTGEWGHELLFKAVNADITRVGGSAMMTEGLSCDSTNESTVQECVNVMNDLDKNLFSWTDYGDSQGALWQPSELQRSVWARTYARAIAGKPLNMTFSSDTKAFELCYAIDTAIKAPTEVFTSLKYSYPAGASLRTTTNLVATPSGDVVSVMPTASAKAGDTGCIWISKL